MSTLNEGTLAAQPQPGAATESGTGAVTGSEPNYTGTSNDSTHAAIVRAESFLKEALAKLAQWLHIKEVADAHASVTNALAHTAEGKALAVGEQPSGAAAAAGAQPAAPGEPEGGTVEDKGAATGTEGDADKQ